MSSLTCLRCQNEVDESLDACPNCGEKITGLQRTYGGRLIDGKYQILERLGIGGMGEIFKVRHIHLNEQRVIKIMRANIAADEQALQRFLHEARLATMIKHRNLAMLYDFSTLDDGSYYMVWEYIEGTNIQKWISDNGPMPPRLAVEIAIQALGGLGAIHQMGIIHRDISPENIMLSQDHQGKLLVKVIDLGIAKQLSDTEGGQGLTQTGMFLGKLKYASPEQAGFIKEGENLDARTDLYSFGVVVYEMLAGRAPFLATNPQGYILKHATEKPLPISQLNPEVKVPPKLEAIVFKSLEKDRDARHESADDYIAELESVRAEIVPDAKFGVGERLTTLSSRKTAVDITGTNRTADASLPKTIPGRATATRDASQEATRLDKKIVAGGGDATVIETRSGSNDATMVEHLGTSAPTLVEAKMGLPPQHDDAAPTVIEKKFVQETKSRKPLYAGLAAGAVLFAVLAWFMFKPKPAVLDPAMQQPITEVVTQTGSRAVPGLPEGEGILLISASPWGDVSSIRDKNNKEIQLTEDERDSPFRRSLPAGPYTITVADPDGVTKEVALTVNAGKETIHREVLKKISVDEAVAEVFKQ